MEEPDSLLTNDAAQLVGTTGATVRWYEQTGQLRAEKTARGVRIFKRAEVERFIAEREAKRATQAAAAVQA